MKVLQEQINKHLEIEAEKRRLRSIKAEYEKKINELIQLDRRTLYWPGIYKYPEVISVICYLVSLVEGKTYTFGEREIPVSARSGGENGFVYVDLECYDSFKDKYRVQYICCDEEAACEEFTNKINALHALGAYSFSKKPNPLIKKMITEPAENYVQIAVVSDKEPRSYDKGNITFVDNHFFLTTDTFLLLEQNSKICDPRFMYIVDFMHYLTVMKLEKEDFTLSIDEMMAYARDFAEQVKKEKKGDEKILKKSIVEISEYYCE